MHRTYICDVERGARNVSLQKAVKLSDALEVSLLTIFSDFDSKPSAAPFSAEEGVDILIVDGNTNDATQLLNTFKTWGINNRSYLIRDGLSALNFLFGVGTFGNRRRPEKPQLIILDLVLSKMDGTEVLRHLKANPRTATIPVIVLTCICR